MTFLKDYEITVIWKLMNICFSKVGKIPKYIDLCISKEISKHMG